MGFANSDDLPCRNSHEGSLSLLIIHSNDISVEVDDICLWMGFALRFLLENSAAAGQRYK